MAFKFNSWYAWRDKISTFATLPTAEQKDILDSVINRTALDSSHSYYYGDYTWAVNKLVECVDIDVGLKLLQSCLCDKKDESILSIIDKLCLKGVDANTIKNMLIVSNGSSAHKALLCLNNINVDEEEIGLRALATSTRIPYILYNKKYSPSLEALKKLPPIMRLNVLESLLDRKNLPYNVFERINDEEDFKNLLFSATTKHIDRVNLVFEKYKNAMQKGIRGTLTIKYNCQRCGVFELKIDSTIIHSKSSLEETGLSNLANSYCPICRSQTVVPQYIGEIIDGK